jgi:hypothetical protein
VILFPPAHAACDDPVYAVLGQPSVDGGGRGIVTGEANFGGKEAVGGRLLKVSKHSPEAWRKVLLSAETQDDWMPERFGYDRAERIDATHMYLQIDVGLLAGAVHVRRQLVVSLAEAAVGRETVTCWRMIDPEPWKPKIQAWISDAEWERSSTGWWRAEPRPDGGTTVGYQWWAEVGRIPSAVQQFGIRRALPDLVDAFDDRAGVVGP